MKYINKNEEPSKFTCWKALENDDWKPSWNVFQAPEKPIVHDALLKEQGYICSYCGMRITRETSHIEHLKPRSSYPHLALEYTNLIASC
ncbi:retron system putative HNH endonuclease [Amazonocrinis nigriterrae]|uniref:retron system putative HNH endonuclease n=1 Tax=Amazonocrinis nigriterrae TaxID=2840443 RepID=UPI001CEC8EAD|nr:retron system putative HNH endonuclease [Amazonocrinis nigriterrae]